MKICAIMMCKNEDDLISPWTIYHGKLLGFENLYIFDNGSTSAATLEALARAECLGVNVRRDKFHPDHYVYKGDIFSELIQDLDRNSPADFYFPLDCDEFVCAEIAPYNLCFTSAGLEASLEPYRRFEGALMIKAAYDNTPKRRSAFLRTSDQRKTFFAQDACRMLDHGFHCGEGIDKNARIHSSVVYLHFHFKPYAQLVFHARQKIEPFLPGGDLDTFNSGRDGLLKYLEERRPGFHLINHLLFADEIDYLQKFNDEAWVDMPSVEMAFTEVGTSIPFRLSMIGAETNTADLQGGE
ncbi:hypothetical protein RHAL1_00280 [Beijerinckiaceae bacterium RH AL1]|nr:hypothetical protein RHAL8_00268 [Beijerinckiaceae bacterium RH AL8]VVB42602.1 hypothetical protein RHCH11_RHCH11_00269 [Beijerinckiaceae bacterium RH CH11]VVC53399.1 hypothetical protein RHAL1_00280 [Beijerinckiaceae bacterium RH AL1]